MSKVRKFNVHRIRNRFLRGLVMWIGLPISMGVLAPLVLVEAAWYAGEAFIDVVKQRAHEIWRDLIKSNYPTLLFRRVE